MCCCTYCVFTVCRWSVCNNHTAAPQDVTSVWSQRTNQSKQQENTTLNSHWLWICIPQPSAPERLHTTNYNSVAMGSILIGLISVKNRPYANFGRIANGPVINILYSQAACVLYVCMSACCCQLDQSTEPLPPVGTGRGLLFPDISPSFLALAKETRW